MSVRTILSGKKLRFALLLYLLLRHGRRDAHLKLGIHRDRCQALFHERFCFDAHCVARIAFRPTEKSFAVKFRDENFR